MKLEAVSPRLKGELIHPNRNSTQVGVRFSPDGRQIIAGDVPGGVVVLWDVASGERLRTIETGPRFWGGGDYISLSPDWRTLYVPREKAKTELVERDGKRLTRWEFDGDVRAWDLASGQLQRTYKHQPARGVESVQVVLDGTHLLVQEELPGAWEGPSKRVLGLWDVRTGEYRPLPVNLNTFGTLSPDGRTLATSALDVDHRATAIKLLDLETGRERLSVPVADKNVMLYVRGFTPDGRLMAVDYRVLHDHQPSVRQGHLKWWDATTGREIASFAGDANDMFYFSRISPDGRTLAVNSMRDDPKKLRLFRTSNQQLVHTLVLGEKTSGHLFTASVPVFSPDSRWLVITTQMYPANFSQNTDPLDVAQARIHLIDVAAGTIRETLVTPQGFVGSPVFSPDGKTLATSGYGRVLLWDLSTPPGAAAGGR